MRNRILPVLTLAAVAMALLVLRAAPVELPDQLPDPDGKPPVTSKPVKVYILAGQSNMLEMGNVSDGNTRHSTFSTSADGDVSGVEVSVYPGSYSPTVNYDKLTAKAAKTVRYGGMGTDPLPTIDGEATYVVRGFIEVKTSGTYEFSPGYKDSTHNIMELEGREVYQKEPHREAVRVPTQLTGGKRYPFKVTFLTKAASGLFCRLLNLVSFFATHSSYDRIAGRRSGHRRGSPRDRIPVRSHPPPTTMEGEVV